MLKTLIARFLRKPPNPAPSVASGANDGHIEIKPVRQHQGAVHYPPQDPGLDCPTTQEMVDSQADIISKLRLHAANPPAMFSERFLTPITNLAMLLGNLPGTASGVYAGEGGLYRACVELAYNSFRSSDGRIFTGSSGVEERHLLEGRWRYVCFCAALLYPIGAPLQAMQVINTRAQRWSPELDSLIEWAKPGSKYWVTWLKEAVEPGPSSTAGMLVTKVIGRENIDWLNAGSPELMRSMIDIATGAQAALPLVANSVVKEVWASIHERETARRHQNYGRLVVGSHISPYVLDALVILAQDKWVINEKTMFVDGKGVYLEWPRAGSDIIEYCTSRNYHGIPASESALLSMMLANKIVDGGVDNVAITEIADSQGELVGAVKLTKPGLLVDDMSQYQKPGVRPVSVDAVVANDPTVAPSPEAKSAVQRPKKAKKAPAASDQQPKLDTLTEAELSATNGEEDEDFIEEPVPTPVVQATVPASQPTKPSDPLKPHEASPGTSSVPKAATPVPGGEGESIRYADFVPKEVSERLKSHSAEILGKVIHTWRNNDTEFMFRMTSVGAAVEQEFIQQISTRALEAVMEWASLGLIYIDPVRPGVKMHKIALVEGGAKQVNCVVFSLGSCKALGLGD